MATLSHYSFFYFFQPRAALCISVILSDYINEVFKLLSEIITVLSPKYLLLLSGYAAYFVD